MSICSPCPCPDHVRGSCAAGGVKCWDCTDSVPCTHRGKVFRSVAPLPRDPLGCTQKQLENVLQVFDVLAFLGRPEVDTCFTGLITLNVLPRTTFQCRWWEMFNRKLFMERCHLLMLNYLYFSTITMNAAQTSASGTQMKKRRNTKKKKIDSNNNKANQSKKKPKSKMPPSKTNNNTIKLKPESGCQTLALWPHPAMGNNPIPRVRSPLGASSDWDPLGYTSLLSSKLEQGSPWPQLTLPAASQPKPAAGMNQNHDFTRSFENL